jgi:hypothetical protein
MREIGDMSVEEAADFLGLHQTTSEDQIAPSSSALAQGT